MNVLVQDFHSAWRQLSNNPGLSVIAVLTLTLGIGANTAIFSVLNAVLLRPLPFDDPSRLVWLSNYRPGLKDTMVATPDFLAWRSQSRCFRGLAAYDEGDFNLTGAGDPERIHGVFATASLFSVLQVQPAIGRAMRNEESAPGSTPVVILSHEFWRRHFGGDGSVIGNHITLDGTVFEVIGVMPAGSVFPSDNPRPDLIVPLSLPKHPDLTGPQGVEVIQVIGRLSPGVTLAQAEAELSTIEQRLIATYPPGYRNMTEGTETQVIPLQEKLAGKSRPVLLVLLGSVILLLLIASVNTANMQLAKATARRKELALRTALGASRYRLSRQLLCESLLLSLLGGGAGVILAVEAIGVLNRMRPTGLPQFARVGLNYRVLGFTAVVAILTGIVSGLAPAIFACRAGLSDAVKDGIQANTESRGLHFVRKLLVVSEVSLAAVLLVGSGLLIRSFIGLVRIDPGFEPRKLLTLQIALPEAKYSAPSQQRAFFENLSQKLKALPDVTHVGATSELPLTGNTQTAAVLFEGRPAPPPGLRPWIPLGTVTPDYFHTMGIPLVAGREFGYGDRPGSPIVVLVNQAFWRRFFPAENPIGKRIQRGLTTDG
jgi:putative ABC transport system permease protein